MKTFVVSLSLTLCAIYGQTPQPSPVFNTHNISVQIAPACEANLQAKAAAASPLRLAVVPVAPGMTVDTVIQQVIVATLVANCPALPTVPNPPADAAIAAARKAVTDAQVQLKAAMEKKQAPSNPAK